MTTPFGTDREVSRDEIRVLHVDDNEQILNLTATYLERKSETISIVSETDPSKALELIDEKRIDCIVSDFDMPQMDGLKFLEAVRAEHPELPFILFTGKGSEEIASEAISAGVTDYLQKGMSNDQYSLLVNRIENIVKKRLAELEVEETREQFTKLVQYATDVIGVVSPEGKWRYLSPSTKRIMGYEAEELIGEIGFDYVHPDDVEGAMIEFSKTLEDPEIVGQSEFRYEHPERGWVWTSNRARNMIDDPHIQGLIVYTRDITERKQKEQALKDKKTKLEEFTNTLSHDIKNPLGVARGNLELIRERFDDGAEPIDNVEAALNRIDSIVNRTLVSADGADIQEQFETVSLAEVIDRSWSMVETESATLEAEADVQIQAHRDSLQQLFENLINNAIRHGGSSATVRIKEIEDDGFYIEDDGPGIPEDERENVLKRGYSTKDRGLGLGIPIVDEICSAHGWTLQITESDNGGARFEITGVTVG